MPPRLQQVLGLVQEGLSDEELAERMSLTIGSARVYRSKAKPRLKQVTEAANQAAAG